MAGPDDAAMLTEVAALRAAWPGQAAGPTWRGAGLPPLRASQPLPESDGSPRTLSLESPPAGPASDLGSLSWPPSLATRTRCRKSGAGGAPGAASVDSEGPARSLMPRPRQRPVPLLVFFRTGFPRYGTWIRRSGAFLASLGTPPIQATIPWA